MSNLNNSKLILIKDKLYLIIPIVCICLWTLYNLIEYRFILSQNDFIIQYNTGKTVLENPIDLYKKGQGYYYLPLVSLFFAILTIIFPLSIGHYVSYIIILIFAIFMTIEYNRILILMEVKKKSHRFIFLIIITNGLIIFRQFYFHQFKFIMVFFLLFVIRRELHFRKEDREKNLKFYLINYGLFLIVVALFPFYVFLFIIYIFHDINIKNLLKKRNLQKYGIAVLMFAIQNFLFFIYPSLFFSFLNLFSRHSTLETESLPQYNFSFIDDSTIYFLSTIFVVFVICGIILVKKMQIEKKFAYFSLGCIIFSIYAVRLYVVLFPFAILLFIPHLNQDSKGKDFFKKNKYLLFGFLAVIGIYFFDYVLYYRFFFNNLLILSENEFIRYFFRELFILYYPYFLACIIILILFIFYLKNKDPLISKKIFENGSNKDDIISN